jgi:hypothetical protein
MQRLGDLRHGWDGYGALPIRPETLRNARAFLRLTAGYAESLPIPEVSPHSNGTISLEWQHGSAEAYVEIGKSRLSGFVRSSEGTTYFIEGNMDDVTPALPNFIQMHLCHSIAASSSISNWTLATERRLAA